MKKTLLTLTAVFGLAIASSAMANEAESMKQQELRACDMQAQQLPEEVRAKQQESCKCVVENTDYEALVEAKKNGDMAKVQEIKAKASQSCRGAQ